MNQGFTNEQDRGGGRGAKKLSSNQHAPRSRNTSLETRKSKGGLAIGPSPRPVLAGNLPGQIRPGHPKTSVRDKEIFSLLKEKKLQGIPTKLQFPVQSARTTTARVGGPQRTSTGSAAPDRIQSPGLRQNIETRSGGNTTSTQPENTNKPIHPNSVSLQNIATTFADVTGTHKVVKRDLPGARNTVSAAPAGHIAESSDVYGVAKSIRAASESKVDAVRGHTNSPSSFNDVSRGLKMDRDDQSLRFIDSFSSGGSSSRSADARPAKDATQLVEDASETPHRVFLSELKRFFQDNPTFYRLTPNYPPECPRCHKGQFKAVWTPLSIFCCVCIPVLGIPCCYAFREYACTECGELWDYDDPREEIRDMSYYQLAP